MSLISFGVKTSRSKRNATSPLPAFAEPEHDEPEPALSEAQTLSESTRLQVVQNTSQQLQITRSIHWLSRFWLAITHSIASFPLLTFLYLVAE